MVKFVEMFQNFIFDMDGVIYLQDSPISGAREVINYLKSAGKSILFLTNNSYYTAKHYVERLSSMGIQVSPDRVLTSAAATAMYLKKHHQLKGKTAFVIGGPGLEREIKSIGLELLTTDSGRNAHFVIIGWDLNFNYEKMKVATLAINGGAIFIGTNYDRTFPSGEGLWPGGGAIIASIEVATDKKAKIIGKPEKYMVEAALALFDGNPQKTVLIGDRLDSDILAGKRAGIKTILVLTGVTSSEMLEKSDIKPDYILEGIWEIL
ncbi:MAG: HAD-IIA family hydrolase [Actinomycetota bacterium]